MYIRRKVFSVAIDQTTGQERLFSTTEIVSEEAYLKMFSENENVEGEKKKKIPLSKVDSHRGLGRSYLIGGPAGAIGAYTGKSAANKADEEGKSDEDIVKAASKRGRLVGAGLGAAVGAAYGSNYAAKKLAMKNPKLAKAAMIGAGAGVGAVGAASGLAAGHFGAKKNARERVKSRAYLEKEG